LLDLIAGCKLPDSQDGYVVFDNEVMKMARFYLEKLRPKPYSPEESNLAFLTIDGKQGILKLSQKNAGMLVPKLFLTVNGINIFIDF
jgi:hypothetical protein